MVAKVPGASTRVTVGCPAQARVTVLAPVPPLKASSCTRRRAARRVKDSLVEPGPLKPTLLVVNARHGPDRYHRPVPQLMTPAGYCPLSARLGFGRSSKVTVCA